MIHRHSIPSESGQEYCETTGINWPGAAADGNRRVGEWFTHRFVCPDCSRDKGFISRLPEGWKARNRRVAYFEARLSDHQYHL